MHPLIRNSFTLIFLSVISLSVLAGSSHNSPVPIAYIQLKNISKLDSFLSARIAVAEVKKESELSADESSARNGKICSCQVLNLESSNYDHRYVVLLAEKKIDGSGAAFEVAKSRIQKEKKHLKQMFYDKVQVVSEMQGTGSCKSMFYKLRSANSSLQLYEILNADIK